MKPQSNEGLYNKVLGKTNKFVVKYLDNNLDITKSHFREQILPVALGTSLDQGSTAEYCNLTYAEKINNELL